jgi:Ser/Thr protein kinase RdoA (MazF antagonist)
VPAPVPSRHGLLVEHIDDMVVTALPRVPGAAYEDDELTADVARLWGRTLARFHAAGFAHGDPEPDNLVVDCHTATFVDLDDAGPGDPVADIAFALRAWTPPRGAPDLGAEIPAAFLTGYREIRTLADADLARLPAASRVMAQRTLASYEVHLATPADPTWPDWAVALHAIIAQRAAELGTPGG